MTILFLARRFHPLIGGVEKHVFEISKRLIERGFKVIVITELTDNLPTHEILRSPKIEIYRIPAKEETKSKKFHMWKEMWKLRNVIKQADIVHCHDVFYWYLPFRFFYPNKKVYTTFHGYESYPIKKSAIRMRKLSEKLSWGNICIGDFIPKWYGTKPTFISYGAVDSLKFKGQRSNYKKESAVFIGRLDDQTGVLTYIKAIDLVRKKLPSFHLSVVGDGEYKNKIAKKVKVAGFQKNPEDYMAAAQYAFVSRYLGILEAFAAKRLVFAVYDNPIKEDYLKLAPYAEFMVIADTPAAISEKVLYFLKNPKEENALVNKAYQWVQKQSWETMVDLYLKLWQKSLRLK